MSEIIWRPSLAIGVERLDEQHQRLIKIANAVVRIRRKGKSPQVLGGAMQRLREYTLQHFSAEESYMAMVRFPELAKHKAEHEELTNGVIAFQKQLARRHDIPWRDVMHFLEHWLVDHILHSDMKLKTHLSATKKTP